MQSGGHLSRDRCGTPNSGRPARTEGAKRRRYRRQRRERLYPSVAVVSPGFTAFGAAANSWSAIVLAVLGSSALGAIAGGYITTRLRGDIERDEAWRTRLVDCADAFLAELGRNVNAIPHSWLVAVEEGKENIRDDGRLTGAAAHAVGDFEKHKTELMPLMSRVELLFGEDAGVPTRAAVRTVVNAGEVLTGATWIPDGIARFGPAGLGINVENEVPLTPDEFDPDDDADVAVWTRQLLESVKQHERNVLHACSTQIRSRHPRQGAGRSTQS